MTSHRVVWSFLGLMLAGRCQELSLVFHWVRLGQGGPLSLSTDFRPLISLRKLLYSSDLGLPWEPEVPGAFTHAAVSVRGAGSDLIWVQQCSSD